MLYIDNTAIRKISLDNTTIHSVKIEDGTEIFNDELILSFELYESFDSASKNDVNLVGYIKYYITVKIKRKDEFPISDEYTVIIDRYKYSKDIDKTSPISSMSLNNNSKTVIDTVSVFNVHVAVYLVYYKIYIKEKPSSSIILEIFYSQADHYYPYVKIEDNNKNILEEYESNIKSLSHHIITISSGYDS